MSKLRLVLSLGHKDLGTNLPEQKAAIKKTSHIISDLIEEGMQIALVHSNAPQVGMIHAAMNEYAQTHDNLTSVPLSVCSAMSQGYIGYDLQNGIRSELLRRGITKPVSTVLTQVIVDPYDEAFYTPVKKVGRFMDEASAKIEEEKGNTTVRVSPDTFQRIVAAPTPHAIVEIDTIKKLLDDDQIVIACGGGGIPVMKQGTELRGASAVIEKDLASGLLAREVNADILLIVTSVDNVTLNYSTPAEEPLHRMDIASAQKYISEGHFEFASMLPKVQASIDFVKAGMNRRAIITSLERCEDALAGKAGTTISF